MFPANCKKVRYTPHFSFRGQLCVLKFTMVSTKSPHLATLALLASLISCAYSFGIIASPRTKQSSRSSIAVDGTLFSTAAPQGIDASVSAKTKDDGDQLLSRDRYVATNRE